jgi:hypothetical protein
MLYFNRTVVRLDQWMGHCKYKQIHVAILERVFAQVWHERTVATQLAAIRTDRDLDVWEGVKDIAGAKRKREDGIVHSKTGPQLQFSTLFAAVWGIHWRQYLTSCDSIAQWRSMKRSFVIQACECFKLPRPYEGYSKDSEVVQQDRAMKNTGRDMPELRRLQRDEHWMNNSERPQLEFIVDNETVANLMNLEAKVENEYYEPMVSRMRLNIYEVFMNYFEYKGGFFGCHDWRPREYNSQADAVCNWVLDEGCDMEELDLQDVLRRLIAGQMLQIYSDGGFDGERGSASFVVVCNAFEDGSWHSSVCGYRGILINGARSSFQAEMVGADAAISVAIDIGRMWGKESSAKRVRFA